MGIHLHRFDSNKYISTKFICYDIDLIDKQKDRQLSYLYTALKLSCGIHGMKLNQAGD